MAGNRSMVSADGLMNELSRWKGDVRLYLRRLKSQGVRYLSYSQIHSLESCSYRYYLEYVLGLEPTPTPTYYIKGQMVHGAAAKIYDRLQKGKHTPVQPMEDVPQGKLSGQDYREVCNAVEVLAKNINPKWEIVAVEEPFFLHLHQDVPPLFGVIDLIAKHQGEYILVDHKTCRAFQPRDSLQLVLYGRHIAEKYGVKTCSAYYDQYRWVNDLKRIRVPCFKRTPVRRILEKYHVALSRVHRCYRQMLKMEQRPPAKAEGQKCFLCPLANQCSMK